MKRFLLLCSAALMLQTGVFAQTSAPKPALKSGAKTGPKAAPKPATPASAETAPPKTPLLTREELRACKKMVDENMAQATAINLANAELAPERDALKKLGEELKQAMQTHKDGMASLTQERADLLKAGQDLQAKTKDMDKEEGEAAVAAYNAKATAFTARADAYNATGASLNAQVVAHGERVTKYNKNKDELLAHEDAYKRGSAAWKAACFDRRYDEADEIAIKNGK